MKAIFLIPLLLFGRYALFAQLVITPGGQFSIFSDTKLTLKNTDLVNDGDFLAATTSPVSFTGDATSTIEGNEATRFFKIAINKTVTQSVVLKTNINVGSTIVFTSGFFDLNGFNVDLETTGSLISETNDSRFVGAKGGQIILTTNLNSPSNVNPGNLGIVFTSNQNLGQVIIKRGHQQQIGSGLSSSILRYFDILPPTGVTINGNLRVNYFDGELNGISEKSLEFFETANNTDWTSLGSTSNDPLANFVERTVASPFSRLTLSAPDNVLPVRFLSFNVNCDPFETSIKWTAAQEQNADHYSVERSTDGINWTVINKQPAATSGSYSNNYAFVDNRSQAGYYYRISEFDRDGKAQYTSILRSPCGATHLFSAWPNPVHGNLFLNVYSNTESQPLLKMTDATGRVVKAGKINLLKGNNQLTVNMSAFANGTYYLSVEFTDGTANKATEIVKN